MSKSNDKSESRPRRSTAELLRQNQQLIDPSPETPNRAPESASEARVPLVTIAHRWPQELVDALIQVSAARKVARQKPWLQQEITAQAMREWLDRHSPKASA